MRNNTTHMYYMYVRTYAYMHGVMYSEESEKRREGREEERKEREQLALKKKDVRRKVRKYDRLQGTSKAKAAGGRRGLKGILQHSDRKAEQAAKTAARLELLLSEEPGYVEAEGLERTFCYRQPDIAAAVPVANQRHYFDLKLDQLGPYTLNYSRSGRHLLIGGSKGHVATLDWKDKRLGAEFHVRETVRDVQFLHNEMLFAVAQKRCLYIYDHTGMELHCLKKHDHVNRLTFLPYHFLLVSADDHGTLRYLDTSTGQPVAEIKTKLGALKTLAQNPRNGVVQLGHFNGCVSLWSPNVSSPLAKLQCHRGPLTSLAVDQAGHCLITAAMDAKMKVWDLRMYRPLHTHSSQRPAVCMDISGRGLLAVGWGKQVEVWRGALTERQTRPYLTHRVQGEVSALHFCPFEDCLGIGHASGFSSMIVPGAGEPNFDALEANPYQTKRQRQETEVKQLLEKIPSELISLDPDCISKLRTKTASGQRDESDEGEGKKEKRLSRSKASGQSKALKKQKRKEEQGRARRRQEVQAELSRQRGRQSREDSSEEESEGGGGSGEESEGEGSSGGEEAVALSAHGKRTHILDRFR